MKTSSCKAKARALQNAVREMIAAILPDEFKCQSRTAIMGETGTDIKLVSKAREIFPWAVECKNQERLSLWDAWGQTTENAVKEQLKPLLFVKKNRTDILVVLKATDFFELIGRLGGK